MHRVSDDGKTSRTERRRLEEIASIEGKLIVAKRAFPTSRQGAGGHVQRRPTAVGLLAGMPRPIGLP